MLLIFCDHLIDALKAFELYTFSMIMIWFS